jgi:bacterioferritin
MHEKSIDLLNQALADELAAIHQYMYYHFHCDDQGYDPLAALFRQIAMAEMRHAEALGERILFLKGDAEMKLAADVQKNQDVAAMLAHAKSLEEAAVMMYNRFANECAQHGDSVTKKLFEGLVADEESHYDSFDIQEEHLSKFGEQFLALQSMERSRSVGAAQGEA